LDEDVYVKKLSPNERDTIYGPEEEDWINGEIERKSYESQCSVLRARIADKKRMVAKRGPVKFHENLT